MNRIFIILLLITAAFFNCNQVFAETTLSNSGIVLDGSFNDWNGKPYIMDTKHDVQNTWQDFSGVKYCTDNQYLYLDVQRLSANKSESWHFNVVILNALTGDKLVQYIYGTSNPIYAPQFDITTSFTDNKSDNGAVVDVSFDGEDIEDTYSCSNDGKEIEFRIPLQKVGLDGINKMVVFMLKSNSSKNFYNVDWVPNGYPIIITNGPTFWQLSSIVFFAAVSYAAFKIYRKTDMENIMKK